MIKKIRLTVLMTVLLLFGVAAAEQVFEWKIPSMKEVQKGGIIVTTPIFVPLEVSREGECVRIWRNGGYQIVVFTKYKELEVRFSNADGGIKEIRYLHPEEGGLVDLVVPIIGHYIFDGAPAPVGIRICPASPGSG